MLPQCMHLCLFMANADYTAGSAAYHPTPILTSSPGSSSPAAGTLSPATPNSFAASNPQSITTPSGAQSGLDELLAAEELVAGLRAHSNPSLPRRSNSILNSLGGPVEPARSAASETGEWLQQWKGLLEASWSQHTASFCAMICVAAYAAAGCDMPSTSS